MLVKTVWTSRISKKNVCHLVAKCTKNITFTEFIFTTKMLLQNSCENFENHVYKSHCAISGGGCLECTWIFCLSSQCFAISINSFWPKCTWIASGHFEALLSSHMLASTLLAGRQQALAPSMVVISSAFEIIIRLLVIWLYANAIPFKVQHVLRCWRLPTLWKCECVAARQALWLCGSFPL